MSDSDIEELLEKFNKLKGPKCESEQSQVNMASITPEQLQSIIEAAVSRALASQEKLFEEKIKDIRQGLSKACIRTP